MNRNYEAMNETADRTFRGYFLSEMPSPWPACQATARTEVRKAAPRFGELAKRYLALALSILFLMAGLSMASDWLVGKPSSGDTVIIGPDGAAERIDKDGNRIRGGQPRTPNK